MYDVIILGSGPAGLTASIYTARSKLKTLVITGSMVGGQIAFTYQVDNFPGFPTGISGPELTQKMKEQAERFGAEFFQGEVTKVDFKDHPFRVYIGNDEFNCITIVIATGSINKKLGLESEEKFMGRGVFVCATCDALLYEDKKVVVVGGGDSALQEALDLAKYAREVNIIHRREKLSACLFLQEKINENKKISYIWNSEVIDIIGKNKVEGVKIINKNTGKTSNIECDGILIAIGWKPNTSLFSDQLDLDVEGYIVSETGVDTSVPGVFVAGDINDRKYRQVVTACSSGCVAALEAERYINEHSSRVA